MKKCILILSVSLLALGASAGKVDFKKADKDKDGFLTKEEFAAERQKMYPSTTPEKTEKIFEIKDLNKDGKLTKEEFESDQ